MFFLPLRVGRRQYLYLFKAKRWQVFREGGQIPDPQERLRIALEELQRGARQGLPEIERLPVHYYEDGIGGLALALRLRQIVAFQHWLGNSEYSLDDASGRRWSRGDKSVQRGGPKSTMTVYTSSLSL